MLARASWAAYSPPSRSPAALGRLHRIVALLSYAPQNVVREVKFFEETAQSYGLGLEGWRERKATRDYTAEIARVPTGEHREWTGVLADY